MAKKDKIFWFLAGTFSSILIGSLIFFSPRIMAKSNPVENYDSLSSFNSVFNYLQNNYVDEVTTDALIQGSLKGLFTSLNDPYSMFLSPSDMDDMRETTDGTYAGVGMYIEKSAPEYATPGKPSYVDVVGPIEGTPAFKAGVNAGDKIIKIDGESVVDWTLDQALMRIKGQAGTEVTLTILRGKSLVFDVTLVRQVIEVPTVKFAMMPNSIAYLRITQFTGYTAGKVKEAIEYFKKNNYKSLVIDVRSNPGGLLESVIEIADYFLGEKVIVSTKSRLPDQNSVRTGKKGVLVPDSIPIALLINKGSASASEILAGALKDNGRATIIGSNSYGKGSVQNVIPLNYLITPKNPELPAIKNLLTSGVRFTISRYYTPSDFSVDKVGIAPNIEIIEPELTEAETALLQKLYDDKTIELFVEGQPNPSSPQIEAFMKQLHGQGITLSDRLLRKMISQEVNKTINNQPVFDLDYDLILQKAAEVLKAK